jgi:hypothetical protein
MERSYKVGLLLVFLGTALLISIVVVLVHIPANIVFRVPFLLHPHQHLLLLIFLIIASLNGDEILV